MSAEEWRPIPGYEGRYEASANGEIRSLLGATPRLLKRCWHNTGYPRASLWDASGGHVQLFFHQWIALTFLGPPPPGLQVRHLDGSKDNCSAANLAYGTVSENGFDRVRHGTDLNSSKTECIRGHAFDEENTLHTKAGHRICRTCSRAHKRRSYYKRKAAA